MQQQVSERWGRSKSRLWRSRQSAEHLSAFRFPRLGFACHPTTTTMPRTREGYRHDAQNGLSEGFETDAVVLPPSNFSGRKRWDTIVIGAGYAGLIAARDLAVAGKHPCSFFLSEVLKLTPLSYRRPVRTPRRGQGPSWRAYMDGEGEGGPYRDGCVLFFFSSLSFQLSTDSHSPAGGTWIHWCQAFVWTELVKYGLDTELIYTPNSEWPEEAKSVVRFNGAFCSLRLLSIVLTVLLEL